MLNSQKSFVSPLCIPGRPRDKQRSRHCSAQKTVCLTAFFCDCGLLKLPKGRDSKGRAGLALWGWVRFVNRSLSTVVILNFISVKGVTLPPVILYNTGDNVI